MSQKPQDYGIRLDNLDDARRAAWDSGRHIEVKDPEHIISKTGTLAFNFAMVGIRAAFEMGRDAATAAQDISDVAASDKPMLLVFSPDVVDNIYVVIWAGLLTYYPECKMQDVRDVVGENHLEYFHAVEEQIIQRALGAVGMEDDDEAVKKVTAAAKSALATPSSSPSSSASAGSESETPTPSPSQMPLS